MASHTDDRSMHPWSSLFQVDELAAHQYMETFRRRTPLMPEQSLLLAVLEDAIITYQEKIFRHDDKSESLVREVETWIDNTDNDGFFSYENVCQVLNLSPSYLRAGLLRWTNRARAKQEARAAPARPRSHRANPRHYQHSINRRERQIRSHAS